MLDLGKIKLDGNYEFKLEEEFSSIPQVKRVLTREESLIPLGDLFSLRIEDYVLKVYYMWIDWGCVELEAALSQDSELLHRDSAPIEIKEDMTLDDLKSQLFNVFEQFLDIANNKPCYKKDLSTIKRVDFHIEPDKSLKAWIQTKIFYFKFRALIIWNQYKKSH